MYGRILHSKQAREKLVINAFVSGTRSFGDLLSDTGLCNAHLRMVLTGLVRSGKLETDGEGCYNKPKIPSRESGF